MLMAIKSKSFVRWIALVVVGLGIAGGIALGFHGTAKTPPATNSPLATNSQVTEPGFLDLSIGQNLTFNIGGSGLPALQSGWSGAEPWGTWSSADQSTIGLKLMVLPTHDAKLVIKGHAFLFGSHKLLNVKVDINGVAVASIDYKTGADALHSISVPLKVISSDGGRLLVHFVYDTPKSPKEVGMSIDTRTLALGIIGLQLND
jgi:hypothetical protein